MSDARKIFRVVGIPWPKTHYHAHFGLPEKGRSIKEFVVSSFRGKGSRFEYWQNIGIYHKTFFSYLKYLV